jgi:hypothetical protein
MTSRIRAPRPNSLSDPGDHGKGSRFTKGDPRINRKGGPGRRPVAWTRDFIAWCKAQLDSPEAQAKLAKRMWKLDRFGRSDPVLMLIIQYAFGKPKAVVERRVSEDMLNMLTREELEALVRIADRIGAGSGTPAGPQPLDPLARSRGRRPPTH